MQIHFKGKSTTRNQKTIAERIETMTKSPIVVTIWRGVEAIKVCANACSELRHQFALDPGNLGRFNQKYLKANFSETKC